MTRINNILETSTCNNGIEGCDHSSSYIKGSNRLLQLEEMMWLHDMEMKVLCDENLEERKEEIIEIEVFMMSKDWSIEDIANLRAKYVCDIEDAHNPVYGDDVGDIQVDLTSVYNAEPLVGKGVKSFYANRPALDYKDRMDEETDMEEEYWDLMEKNVTKSGYSWDAKSFFPRTRIALLGKELKLHGKIQDGIDAIPDLGKSFFDMADAAFEKKQGKTGRYYNSMGKYTKACIRRLDVLKENCNLSYGAWIMFNNEVMAKLGKKGMEDKYDTRGVADTLTYWEDKLEAEREEMWERKDMVSGCKLEPEGDELIEWLEEEGHEFTPDWDKNEWMWGEVQECREEGIKDASVFA